MLNHIIYELIVTAFFLCFATIMTAFIYWSDIKGWLKKKTDRLFYKMGYSPTYFQPCRFDVHEVYPIEIEQKSMPKEVLKGKESNTIESLEYAIAHEIACSLRDKNLIQYHHDIKDFHHTLSMVLVTGRLKVLPPKTK